MITLPEARQILGEMTKSASLLRHMRTVELVMEAYAEKFGEYKTQWAIAGLLHDMGRIVLSQKLPAEFEKVLQAKRQAGIPQLQAEQAVLKLTHGDIGGWLARKWNLPVPFVEVLRLHHFPLRILEGDPLPDETANLVFKRAGAGG